MNIYVYNLSPELTGVDLEQLFSCYGEVLSAEVQKSEVDGKSQTIPFIHMPIAAQARNAIAELNGMLINGKKMYVQQEGENPSFQHFT